MREVINVTYFDPRTTIFKDLKRERESVSVCYCDCKDNCNAYKNCTCVLLNGLWGHRCPHGEKIRQEGFTRNARRCGELTRDYKNRYPDKLSKLSYIKRVEKLNDYWYINLPWLDCNNSVPSGWFNLPEDKKKYYSSISNYLKEKVINEDLVKDEDFNTYFLEVLLDFRPLSYMGGVIKDYYNKKLPQFFYDLRKYYPDKYNELKDRRPEVEELANKVSFKGKYALLNTLNPGKVKVNTNIFDWDGEKIVTTAKQASMWGKLEDAKVIIYPSDNSVVEIIDDNTVHDNTIFK